MCRLRRKLDCSLIETDSQSQDIKATMRAHAAESSTFVAFKVGFSAARAS